MKKRFLALLITIILICPVFVLPVYSAGVDLYAGFAPSAFDDYDGVAVSFSTNGDNVGGIGTGWIRFKNVDFGAYAPYAVDVNVGAPVNYATAVLLRVDDPKSEPIAKVYFETLGWGKYVMTRGEITKPVTGKHDLYVSFDKSTADLNYIRFFANIPGAWTYSEYNHSGPYSNLKNDSLGHNANILYQLGMLQNSENGEFDALLPTSRADFAYSIYRIHEKAKGEEDESTAVMTKFTDVENDHANAKAITYLSEYGIMNGVSDTEFKPKSYIKYTDALVVILRMLGFTEVAENAGGYPQGYLAVAAKEGLIGAGVDVNASLRRGDMIHLLKNALEADCLAVSSVVDPGYVVYEREVGILSQTQKVYKGKGLVTATAATSLYLPDSKLDTDKVAIDGHEFYVGDTKADTMLGLECEIYYEEKDGERTLRAIAPLTKTEYVELVSPKDAIESMSNKEIIYCVDGSNKSEEFLINSNTAIIYNGVAADDTLTNLVDNDESFIGKIRLIENSDGSRVVHIDEYVDYEIESVDLRKKTIFGKNSNVPIDVSGEDDDYIFIWDNKGEKTDLKSLSAGGLITVYQSKNRTGAKLIRIYCEEQSLTGKITQIVDDKIYINEEAYAKSNNCTMEFKVGQTSTFRLNKFGEIVSYDLAQDALAVALYMGMDKNGSVLNNELRIKLINKEGKVDIYPIAKTLTADGVKANTSDYIANGKEEWVGLNSVNSEVPVQYRLNANGEIALLDTPHTGTGGFGDTLSEVPNFTTDTYNYNLLSEILSSKINEKGRMLYYLPKTATVFYFHGSGGIDENCVVGTAQSLFTYSGLDIKGFMYSTEGKQFEGDILVWLSPSESRKPNPPIIVDKVTQKLDDDGEIINVIRGISCEGEIEYIIDEETMTDPDATMKIINNLKTGDVISSYKTDKEFIISCTMLLLYDGAESRRVSGGDPITARISNVKRQVGDVSLNENYIYGPVTEVHDNYIVIDVGGKSEIITFGNAVIQTVNKRSNGEYSIGDSVKKQNINVGDAIFAFVNERQVKQFVIYNDDRIF